MTVKKRPTMKKQYGMSYESIIRQDLEPMLYEMYVKNFPTFFAAGSGGYAAAAHEFTVNVELEHGLDVLNDGEGLHL